MIKHTIRFCILLFFGCIPLFLIGQDDYRNASQIQDALQALVRQHPSNASIESLTKTPGGQDIWVLTLSEGQADQKPAMLIAAGVDGRHLLSVELAAELAQDILENKKAILDQTTFYILPNLNPDASQQYFQDLKYERIGNGTATDDDRDGDVGEDPFEDLNGDGMITMMRVADPTGSYIPLEEDQRIMVKADAKKGQVGTYKLLTEGRDNDQDGSFNEDGEGGVSFNRNLSYNFPYFTPGAGEHPVSQMETRAVLDFLYEQWNIYGILTFGPANNLSSPLKYAAPNAKKRVVTSILAEDAPLNALISDTYNKIVPKDDAPASVTAGGGFFEWSYFHFGRLAMSTPAWWAPQPAKDTTVKDSKNAEVNFLRWAAQQEIEPAFVEWTSIQHPDFPNQKVEVGGIAPFVRWNPPYSNLPSIVEKHSSFLEEVVAMQASLNFTNLKQEDLGNGIHRISVDLHNPGILPTHTQMGDRSRWLKKIKVELMTSESQKVLSGRPIQLVERIRGDEVLSLSWLVQGGGSLVLKAGAPHLGQTQVEFKL